MNDEAGYNLKDLETEGYCIVKNFLTKEEINYAINDFEQSDQQGNKNYKIKSPSVDCILNVYNKLSAMAQEITATTEINVDMITNESAFIDNSTNQFQWHQEHEPFFTFQQLTDYVIFYMPIIKEQPDMSGVDVIPFSILKEQWPDYASTLMQGGARTYLRKDTSTLIVDDDQGTNWSLPRNIDDLKKTPEIMPGDLLIMRGNLINRTQDTKTRRVAFTAKFTNSQHLIERKPFVTAAPGKQKFINNNPHHYNSILKFFDNKQIQSATARAIMGTYQAVLEFKLLAKK